MGTDYKRQFGRSAVFRVRYRFLPESQSGRKTLPCQGYRCDFAYDDGTNEMFMIWPFFESQNDTAGVPDGTEVPNQGCASMWIVVPEMIRYHKERAKSGVQGFFMEGNRKVAVVEII